MHQLANMNYWTETSTRPIYDSMWDSNQIYGCFCALEWFGHNCGIPYCPTGDDPISKEQSNEIQLMYCFAAGGTFTLRFGEYVTPPLNVNGLTAGQLESALGKLPSIVDAKVTLSSGSMVCSSTDNILTSIEFMQEFGPDYRMQYNFGITALPPLQLETNDIDGVILFKRGGAYLLGTPSVQSQKENELCSNRGDCNFQDGTCTCYFQPLPRFRSSDGYGNPGLRGDCGSMDPIDDAVMTDCPGLVTCNLQGECESTTYRCGCSPKWTGGDCSRRVCPKGPSWFDFPRQDNQAHTTYVTCSNKGKCDTSSGYCVCAENFEGAACEFMSCANNCNGHGECMPMKKLSKTLSNGAWQYGTIMGNPATWDADRIYGCFCDEGYEGYDCSQRTCPYGDDPNTYGQLKEVQLVVCIASGGFFRLTWQSSIYTTKTTTPLPWNATNAEVRLALEMMGNIGQATVRYSSRRSACLPAPLKSQYVYFDPIPSAFYLGKVYPLVFTLSVAPSENVGLVIAVTFRGYQSGFGLSTQNVVFNKSTSTGTVLITPKAVGVYKFMLQIQGFELNRFMFHRTGTQNFSTDNVTVYQNYQIVPPRNVTFINSSAGGNIPITLGLLPSKGQNVSITVVGFNMAGLPTISFRPSTITWSSTSSYTQSFRAFPFSPGFYKVSFYIKSQTTTGVVYALIKSGPTLVQATSGSALYDIIPPFFPSILINDSSPVMYVRLSTVAPRGLSITLSCSGVKFQPSVLAFAAGSRSASFTFNSGFVAGDFAVNFHVSGQDAGYFKTITARSISVLPVNVMQITFLTENGNLRPIQTNAANLVDKSMGSGTISVYTDGQCARNKCSVSGTTEFIECSGRGLCDHDKGICNCYTGYRSSNGNGQIGNRGECGYKVRM